MNTNQKENRCLTVSPKWTSNFKAFYNRKVRMGIDRNSEHTSINKSTVSRLVTDLVAEGFLQKEQRKYSLGFSLLSMSGVITSHLEIHRESKDILKKLVDELGETAHIAVLEGKEITYVHKIECKNPVRLLSSDWKKESYILYKCW